MKYELDPRDFCSENYLEYCSFLDFADATSSDEYQKALLEQTDKR